MTFGSSASVDSYVLGLRAVALGFKRPTKNLLVKGNTDQNRWFSRVSWAMWFVAGKKGSYETSESTIIFFEDQAGVVICLNVGLYFLTLAQPKRCLHRLCRFSGRLRRFVRRLLGGWKSEMGLSALIGSPPAKSLQVNSMIALHLLTCWEFSWSFGDFLTNYNSSSSKCKFRTYLPK